VEDAALAGGFGSAVLELMCEHDICVPVARFGIPDAFVPQGPVRLLRRDIGLTAESLAAAGEELLRREAQE
jgi:1-deoxy-D-xylulose-5-phosphate synthase